MIPRRVKVFVTSLFVLLAVPAVIGFDAWPLTAWRLFSADRGADQTRWEIVAVGEDGSLDPVDLDELTVAYRNAEWILAQMPGATDARRQAVCLALLDGVREHVGVDAVGLQVVRNRRQMVEDDDGFAPVDDREPFDECEGP